MQGIVTLFNLNEMFRYSLLHKHIICTTLLFHRAFLEANWSWLSCIYNNLWNGSWIVINSSFQPLVIHNITCIHLNASQHLHLYLCNQSLTPFICIHSMHDYKIHKIFLMHIHSMLPCIDSGILCIQHTMTASYRMHYYNQEHQYLLSLGY